MQLVLIVNAVVLLMVIVLSVPLGLVIRDAKKTLTRFGVVLDPAELTGQKEDEYINAARKVFDDDPETVAFIYGHTHKPSVRRFGERAVINTGTWLKQFERVSTRFGLLPPVYVPRYRLPGSEVDRVWKDGHGGSPVQEKAVPGPDVRRLDTGPQRAGAGRYRADGHPGRVGGQ